MRAGNAGEVAGEAVSNAKLISILVGILVCLMSKAGADAQQVYHKDRQRHRHGPQKALGMIAGCNRCGLPVTPESRFLPQKAWEGSMKLAGCIAIFAGLAALTGIADARQVYVPGFYRPNGTWVAPHYRTVPDGTVYDYPADPNLTPYNGNPYTAPVPHPYPYQGYYPYGAPYVPPPASAPVPYYGTP